jgi:hypothetical protein
MPAVEHTAGSTVITGQNQVPIFGHERSLKVEAVGSGGLHEDFGGLRKGNSVLPNGNFFEDGQKGNAGFVFFVEARRQRCFAPVQRLLFQLIGKRLLLVVYFFKSLVQIVTISGHIPAQHKNVHKIFGPRWKRFWYGFGAKENVK